MTKSSSVGCCTPAACAGPAPPIPDASRAAATIAAAVRLKFRKGSIAACLTFLPGAARLAEHRVDRGDEAAAGFDGVAELDPHRAF